MDAFASSEIGSAARPLLHLARQITGLQTIFVCASYPGAPAQRVVHCVDRGDLEVREGSVEDWQDSVRRSALGIQAFCSAPIRIDENAVALLCAAGRTPVEMSAGQLEGLRLVAEAFEHLVVVDRKRTHAETRTVSAEQALADARDEAMRYAADSLQMQRLAHTDVLTGLPNRRGFMTRWEDQVARATRRNTPLGLLLIDADNFKEVNDTMGHAMGDSVLRAISAALLIARRTPDIVARLGGDEFALATASADARHLQGLAEEIRKTFAVVAEELGVETTLSIGIVSSASCSRDSLLAEADEALYRSKAAGGNTYEMKECAQS